MTYPDDNIAWQNRFVMNGEFQWALRDAPDAEQEGENRG